MFFTGTNSNALIEKWITIKKNTSTNCEFRLEKKEWTHLYRDSELDEILLLLKAFPVTRISFKQSLAAFIVYSDVRFLFHGD